MQKLEEITGWLAVVILGITPLFFFPLTTDYYDFNKWALVTLAGAATLFLFGLRLALTGKLEIHWSPLASGLLALAVSSLASTLIVSTNKTEAMIQPLGFVTYISLFLLTVSLSVTEKKYKTFLLWFLSAGAGVAGLVAIYGALGLGKAFNALPFLANPLWTPLGASIPLLAYLVILLPLTIGHAIRSFRQKEEVETTIAIGISIVTALGMAVSLWQLVKAPIQLLPLWANWSILAETIKQPLHAVFGVGPQNFLAAFTEGRPVTLNASAIWDARFTAGSSFLFHQATTLGILGAIATLFFFRSCVIPILRSARSLAHLDYSLALLLALLALLFLPPSLPICIASVAVILITTPHTKTFPLHLPKKQEWAGTIAGGLLIIAALVGTYLLGRVYLAEISFGSALAALVKNDGTGTYQALLTTIARNPSSPRYHAALSQTSLSLAATILNRATDAKTALSDKDKQLVTDFYQQAIREAKVAINAAPKSVIMWENLANIYREFLGIATNADAWTIAALSRAIALDPTNPLLFMQMGSVYLRTNRLDEAISMFQSAVSLKNDLANAHYNLAFAYRQKKQYLRAAIEFRRASQLVRPGSTDADRVAADIAETMSSLSSEEITSLWQTPAQIPAVSTEEILSPVVEFSPIPTPTLTLSP
jgi:tetratricopeptide (TPR) repeat protein